MIQKFLAVFLRCTVACILLLALPVGLSAAADAGVSRVELTILHLNDLHGHILPQSASVGHPGDLVGGAAHLAKMIERQRAQNPDGTLLVAAGDLFQGTPISNVFYGRPVVDVLNALRFDASAVGNHEFDWGRPRLQELSSAAHFPFLAANIVDASSRWPDGLTAYTLVQRKGLRIALIGLTTPDVPFTTKPGNTKGLIFLKPEQILPPLVAELRAKGADLIVVLSHLGFDEDRLLARKVAGIHVIVGGHTHTAVSEPVEVNRTLIVQAKCYAEYLGVLKITFDRDTKEILAHGKQGLKKVWSRPDDPFDPAIDKLVQEHYAHIKEKFAAVIGETRVELTRSIQGESTMGNLVCDAARHAAGADMAFQNTGGIRADIPSGKITLEQLFTVLPFDNQLMAMSLTGAQIRGILERNLRRDGTIGLQVSGLQVTYDMKQPLGARVKAVTVGGGPLDDEKIYRVATNDFLAAGGDRFGYFKDGKEIVYHGDFRDAVTDYLRNHSPVAPRIEGRIRFLNAEPTENP